MIAKDKKQAIIQGEEAKVMQDHRKYRSQFLQQNQRTDESLQSVERSPLRRVFLDGGTEGMAIAYLKSRY